MKTMKPILFFLLVGLMGCQSSNSQSKINTEKSEVNSEEITRYIDTFFEKYKSDGPNKAVDYIFSTNKYSKAENQLNNLKGKLDSVNLLLGKFTGAVKITEKDVSKDLVLVSYLVKYTKQPIRFTFIFYKPETSWVLYQFLYDDETVQELEDSAKIYIK
jgi:hypothetical protein